MSQHGLNLIGFEDKVNDLKELSETYKNLPDIEKVKNIELYNSILLKQRDCYNILHSINTTDLDNTDVNDEPQCTDENFTEFIQKMDNYKAILENDNIENMPLYDILNLMKMINNLKERVDAYIEEKKMIIINIA